MAEGKKRIETDIVAYDRASHIFKQVADNMQSSTTRMNKSVDSIVSGLHKYNNAMHSINRSTQVATAAAGYFIYKFTKDSIRQFAEFEREHGKTMGAMATNYDKTAASQRKFYEDQARLKEQALKLGTVGPTGIGALYDPKQVAFSQTQLVKAGRQAKDITGTDVVPRVLKFAGGNDLPLDTATEYAVNIAEMFGVSMEKWGDMLDKLTKTADISTIDVDDLFQSLKYTGGIAAGLNRPMEEILGMIAIMGNAGLKGSMSGTGIQALFTRLLSPIGKSEKALDTAPTEFSRNMLEAFVSEVTDSTGKFKPMPEVTDLLDKAMSELNDKEQAWFAHKLFGLFQMKAAYALKNNGITGDGTDSLQDVINEITNRSGGTNDMKWDIMLGTSWGKQTALGNMFHGTKTDIGYRLSPVTNAITDELFKVLANKGNYQIDFGKLRTSINKASDMITEQYGKQVGELVKNVANLGLDGSRILAANEPLGEGIGLFFAKLIGGDLPGAIGSLGESIKRANGNIDELPPELQTMARQVRNVIMALATLTGINISAKIAESVATVWKYTLGKLKVEPAKTVQSAVTNINAEVMNVRAVTVYLTGAKVYGGVSPTNPGSKTPIVGPTGGGSGGSGVVAMPATGNRTGKKVDNAVNKAYSVKTTYTKDRNGNLVEDLGNGVPNNNKGVAVGIGPSVKPAGNPEMDKLQMDLDRNQKLLEKEVSEYTRKSGEIEKLKAGQLPNTAKDTKLGISYAMSDKQRIRATEESMAYNEAKIKKLQDERDVMVKKMDTLKASQPVVAPVQTTQPTTQKYTAKPGTVIPQPKNPATGKNLPEPQTDIPQGTSAHNGGPTVVTPPKTDTTKAKAKSNADTKTTPKMAGLAGKFGNALGVYSILSTLGIPQFIMDRIGLENGSEERDIANRVDSALNWAGILTYLATATGALKLLGGAAGGVKVAALAMGKAGATAAASVAGGVSSAAGALTATGASAAGAGALLALPVVAGGAMILDATQKENLANEIKDTIKNADAEGRAWTWNDRAKNGFLNHKENPIVVYGKTKAEEDESQYQFQGQMWLPNKPKDITKLDEWQTKMNEISDKTKYDQTLFKSAQFLYAQRTGGDRLTWADYNKNRNAWSEDYAINGDGSLIADRIFEKINSITNQPPVVNVGAPAVTVNVTVDKDGNVTKETRIGDWDMLDGAFHIIQSRKG